MCMCMCEYVRSKKQSVYRLQCFKGVRVGAKNFAKFKTRRFLFPTLHLYFFIFFFSSSCLSHCLIHSRLFPPTSEEQYPRVLLSENDAM